MLGEEREDNQTEGAKILLRQWSHRKSLSWRQRQETEVLADSGYDCWQINILYIISLVVYNIVL